MKNNFKVGDKAIRNGKEVEVVAIKEDGNIIVDFKDNTNRRYEYLPREVTKKIMIQERYIIEGVSNGHPFDMFTQSKPFVSYPSYEEIRNFMLMKNMKSASVRKDYVRI